MNELISMNEVQRISSREIAELTGKQHNHVMRDIRNLIEQGAIGQLNYGQSSYINSQNKKQPMYLLDKEASLVLATGYNAVLRAKIVKRWIELEAKQSVSKAALADPIIQLRLAQMETEKKIEKVNQRLDQIETAEEYFTIMGYASLNGYHVDRIKASILGKNATALCNDNGYETSSIPDPRFGRVKTYPRTVLDIVFKEANE